MPAASTAPPRIPVGPDGGQQRDARHRRRQHQRQLDQRDDERLAAERARAPGGTPPACPTSRIIAIEIAVVCRLSQSASRAPSSPRLAISVAGLESTKIATIGSVRKISASARRPRARRANQPPAPHGAGPKPASLQRVGAVALTRARPRTSARARAARARSPRPRRKRPSGSSSAGSAIAFSSPLGGVHVGHVDEAGVRRPLGELARRCPSRRARWSERWRGSPSPAPAGSCASTSRV